MENLIYNPANQSKNELIANFVVRSRVFNKIFADIEKGTMEYPEQHYLIQGQRGMGKTTLLLRLKYEIENAPKLNSWLIPIFFNEESYDLTSLSNLWEKLLKYLDDLWKTGGEYYDNTESFLGQEDYEKKCFDYLIKVLNQSGKKLVVFFDNFGQLFLDNLKEREKRRLREILMHNNHIRIIGASAIVLTDLHDYKEPFYEFFKIIPLDGLDKNETFQLISRLAEKGGVQIDLKKSRAKIETLGILTGGVVRTLMLVYEVVLADQDGAALRDLELILDRITPLYKHRIEDLPVQQRKIIDVIAKQWDAISTKEIGIQIRENGKSMPSKLISAQLQILEKNNVIEKKQTNTKNHLYQVKERFFNIWYLMRNGDRRDRRKVMWLTRFLELWYDDEEGLDTFIKKHIKLLKTGKYNANSAITLSEALASSEKLNILSLDRVFKETYAILNDEQRRQLPDLTDKKFLSASNYYRDNEYDKAIQILHSIQTRTSREDLLLSYCYFSKNEIDQVINTLNGIKKSKNRDIVFQASLYIQINKKDKAKSLMEIYDYHKNKELYVFAGSIYKLLDDHKLAEVCYLSAIEHGDKEVYAELAEFYSSNGSLDKAEKCLIQGIENGADIVKRLLWFYLGHNEKSKWTKRFLDTLDKFSEEDVQHDPDLLVFKAASYVYRDDDEYEINYLNYLEKARKLYLKGNFDTDTAVYLLMVNLLLLDYTTISRNRSKATKLLSEVNHSLDINIVMYAFFVSIWNSDYQKAVDNLLLHKDIIIKENKIIEHDIFNEALLLLLSRRQYNLALTIFNNIDNFKDIFKPTYYALMTLVQDNFPNESIKMGKELNKPVKEILERVKEMKGEYQI